MSEKIEIPIEHLENIVEHANPSNTANKGSRVRGWQEAHPVESVRRFKILHKHLKERLNS